MNNFSIRQENKNDNADIIKVIKQAFENAPHSDNKEHILTEKIKKTKNFIPELSIVAEYEKEIVGYILFSKIKIDNTIQLALAPLCVKKEFQNKGIGKTLIKEGEKIAQKFGFEFIIVLGSPEYYGRFNYIESYNFGINNPFDVEQKYFMAKRLNGSRIYKEGKVIYPKYFFDVWFFKKISGLRLKIKKSSIKPPLFFNINSETFAAKQFYLYFPRFADFI